MEQIISALIGVLGSLVAVWLAHTLSLHRGGQHSRPQTNQRPVAQDGVVKKEDRARRPRIRPQWVRIIISEDESRLSAIALTVFFGSGGGFAGGLALAMTNPFMFILGSVFGMFFWGLAILNAVAAAWIDNNDHWPNSK